MTRSRTATHGITSMHSQRQTVSDATRPVVEIDRDRCIRVDAVFGASRSN